MHLAPTSSCKEKDIYLVLLLLVLLDLLLVLRTLLPGLGLLLDGLILRM